ncbi:MAG: hypothetical protein JNL33_09510 [Betaproteobacteria bacterium]|nr:hypothetical protein [Betaproteobacteria bacterium]
MKEGTALVAIKALHTVVWAFFVACILGAPIAVALGHLHIATLLVALVTFEALVLVLNRWSCPLTGIASRYTPDRRENFDIYLPRWLAKHNKRIFTPLYVAGAMYTALEWYRAGTSS